MAVSRSLAVSALALIIALVGVSAVRHATAPAHTSASQLPWAAKGAISSSLGRDQSAFYATHRSGGLVADNATQGLTAQFETRGVLVRAGTTTFGLQLLAWGAPGATSPVSPATPTADANRVTYAHGPVTEWYANGPLGIEQGFDVRTAPAANAGTDLTLVLGVKGNARTRSGGHGALSLTGPDGRHLSYSGLTAADARGHVLATSLTASGTRAVIHVDTAGAVYPLRIDPFIQVAKSTDPAPRTFAELGASAVDVQGTIAVAAKVTENATMPSAVDVFVANSGRWELGATKVAELADPTPDPTDEGFGTSVALSADGKTIAVGVPSATVPPPPATGVGAEGKILVFEEPTTGGWGGTISAPKTLNSSPAFNNVPDNLGKSVSISADGSIIAGGAPGRASSAITSNVGGVFVFLRPGQHWMDSTTPKVLTHNLGRDGDQMGTSVALSANGNTIVAGTPGFGNPDLSLNLSHLGEAFVFQQPKNGWVDDDTPDAVLLAPNPQQFDFFGQATAISNDATTVVVGATGFANNRGAAFVFTRASGDWTMAGVPAASATLTSSDQAVGLGRSVATDGRVVVAGPFTVAVGGNMGQGAAYVFVEPATGWSSETETQKLVASDGASGDGLGGAVGISNGTVLASAPSADVGGQQDAGALYAFGSFPSTRISIAPATPSGSNGWYVHPVSLAVSASDLDSTVNAIRCVLDPAAAPISFGAIPAACGFLAPAAVSANGSHALFASAANTAGYASAPVSQSFKIDTVAPGVKCQPTPNFTLKGKGGLVAARVTDATSRPAAPIVAKRANVSRAGKKSLKLTGRDNAGNAKTVTCHYTVVARKLPTKINFGFSRFPPATFTIFTQLTATKVPRGAKVDVRCKGGGCPFAHRTVKAPTTRLVCKHGHKQCKRKRAPALTTLNLEGSLAGRHLAPKAVLSVTVTKANTTGLIVTFTVRASSGPTNTTKCLAPGSSKPKPC